MNTVPDHIDRLGFSAFAAWLIIGLIFVTGYSYLKDFIGFILMKFYELFIESKTI